MFLTNLISRENKEAIVVVCCNYFLSVCVCVCVVPCLAFWLLIIYASVKYLCYSAAVWLFCDIGLCVWQFLQCCMYNFNSFVRSFVTACVSKQLSRRYVICNLCFFCLAGALIEIYCFFFYFLDARARIKIW